MKINLHMQYYYLMSEENLNNRRFKMEDNCHYDKCKRKSNDNFNTALKFFFWRILHNFLQFLRNREKQDSLPGLNIKESELTILS